MVETVQEAGMALVKNAQYVQVELCAQRSLEESHHSRSAGISTVWIIPPSDRLGSGIVTSSKSIQGGIRRVGVELWSVQDESVASENGA